MAHVSGQHGSLKLGTNDIVKVRDWSINLQHQPLETTTLGDRDRVRTHGLRNYSGSGTLLYYEDTTSNLQRLVTDTFRTVDGSGSPSDSDWGQKAPEPNSPLKLQLKASEGTIELFVYITNVNVTCATGEVVQAAFTIEGHGAPTVINF